MTENLRIWDTLGKTDPSMTKGFSRAGGFKGTAVKPIWCSKRMTEMFGPCGTGWGMTKPEFQTISVGDDILVYCTVGLWHAENKDGTGALRSEIIYGVGGDKVSTKRSDGKLFNDDEAFKKAFTDGVGNAMKQLGVAADIHMGLFDDAKYVSEMKQEFAEEAPAKPPAEQRPTAQAQAPKTTATGTNMDWLHFHGDAVKQLAKLDIADRRAWWKRNKGMLEQMESEATDLFIAVKDFAANGQTILGAA